MSNKWSEVGSWLVDNAGTGAALVGSMLAGNAPGAIALGASLVASATGTNDPAMALVQLQQNPSAATRLQELANEEQASVREHLRAMEELEIRGHEATQDTIRNGDNSESMIVRLTRPCHATLSLLFAFWYIETAEVVDTWVLGLLLTLPFTYAGLREVGKGITAFTSLKK